MTFEDLLKQLSAIKCDEKRSVTDDYCEIVVSVDELKKLNDILCSCFGAPQKARSGELPAEVERHAEPYGGVRSGQTVYFRNLGSGLELAMLWPWSNGSSLTVKIIRNK